AGPVGVAPLAYHRLVHPDGEVATATGTAGAPFVVSIFASRTIEDIAQAATGPLWLQLYWLRRKEILADLATRAEAAGYRALVRPRLAALADPVADPRQGTAHRRRRPAGDGARRGRRGGVQPWWAPARCRGTGAARAARGRGRGRGYRCGAAGWRRPARYRRVHRTGPRRGRGARRPAGAVGSGRRRRPGGGPRARVAARGAGADDGPGRPPGPGVDRPDGGPAVELKKDSLHRSVTGPASTSMNFLNEVANRFPDAISLAAG